MRNRKAVLMLASVASMIDQFNMPNIRLLQDMGFEVHVACNFEKGNTCDKKRIRALKQTLQGMGVSWHRWDCPRNITAIEQCARAYAQLLQLTGQYPFELLHCHSPIGGVLARLVAHRRGIRVIYTAHGFHFYKGAPVKNWLLYYPVEKLLAYWTDVLVTINKEDYRFAKRNLAARTVCYIPGVGIDTGKFAGKASEKERQCFREKYHISKQATVLLSVGELSARKNHRVVLTALAKLNRPDVYYIICGQGALEQQLLNCAKELGVSGRIRMAGFQEDVTPFYRNADIFVFPSIQEGLPVALMEAMAAGLPCIVSDIRGNRELVDVRGGRRFLLDKPEMLAVKLAELLEERRLWREYGLRNRKIIRKYDWNIVSGEMKKIYTAQIKGTERPCKMISVLIATYEPDLEWLGQLLLSVRQQSYQNYEVVIMDDCSKKVSYQQIREIVQKVFHGQHRVRLLQSGQNEGSNRTFEKLVAEAAGTYVAFGDQDDIWERDKLQKLVRQLENRHAVLAYSDMSVIDEKGRMLHKSLRGMRRFLKYVSGNNLTPYYIMDNCTAACSMLVKTEYLKKALPFYQGTYCDQWICACVSAFGAVAFLNEPLVKYRRHGANQTATFAGIRNAQDYYDNRVLPSCEFVESIKRAGIRFPQERELARFADARKNRDVRGIFKYRRYNRKYAYFDIFVICMPDMFVKKIFAMLHKNR